MQHTSIDMYIQKIHSTLQGGGSVRISTFVEDHVHMNPVLHAKANTQEPDISALLYSLLRLPFELLNSQTILLGQSSRVLEKAGINVDTKDWQPTQAIARARKCSFNKKRKTLAMFIASISDVEDIITKLTALHIEVSKLHNLMQSEGALEDCFDQEDAAKLKEVLGQNWKQFEKLIRTAPDWEVQLLAGSSVDYAKAVQEWWINIASSRKKYAPNVYTQPVYFVSSNSHSLMNVLSGFPLKNKQLLLKDNAERVAENSAAFKEEQVPEENILYYLSRFTEKSTPEFKKAKIQHEKKNHLLRVDPYHHIDIVAQIFSIKDAVKNKWLDPRIKLTAKQKRALVKSDALIINIAYPLGMAAYHILKEVSENVRDMRGVYIMGKAASLNASVGDLTIPHFVQDRHTGNQVFVYNDFNRNTFAPYMTKQSILDAQKAVTVRGTYLQNQDSLQQDFLGGHTIVEMEAGPYLNRIFEMVYPNRHPMNDTFVINTDFRLGLAYYVSDTPQKEGENLGAKRLTWEGLNSTYAISLGIVQDIFDTEYKRHR